DDMDSDVLASRMVVLDSAFGRHRKVDDPIEALAALGGFEIAVMVGVMLVAASKRHLLMVDGMPACAALVVAARIAQPVTDYCVFCRSHTHLGLDQALNLFRASALLEMGLESTDGTGATLAWPLVRSAAALLSEVADGEDPGPTLPGSLAGQDAEKSPSGSVGPNSGSERDSESDSESDGGPRVGWEQDARAHARTEPTPLTDGSD
ncbi:MAG: nicotinate-nucleotide--dimethylbenzimidazole phosphoribosyltransferase, partial [Rubrivivax sp.]